MTQIDFNYEGSIISYQCSSELTMKEIFNNFCRKISININSIYFLYNGKIINDKLPLNKVINQVDIMRNKMNILVIPTNQSYIKNKSLKKSECILCPKCGESSKFEIKDYLITIYGCKNNHTTKNILLEQFENNQLIDESKIVCGFCKQRNKSQSFNKQFYFCIICKKNICLLCKESHDKNHSLIDCDLKNYTCFQHCEAFNSYCKTCNLNICIACEIYHSGHSVISFGKILPIKENLTNQINELKFNIDKFKNEIQKLKQILNHVIQNVDIYFNIINDIFNSFELRKRNYEILSNIITINNNEIIKDFQEIFKENNLQNKFSKIYIIYKKIKNDKKPIVISDANHNSFNNINYTNNNPPNIMNPKFCENSLDRLRKEYNDLKERGFVVGFCFYSGFNLLPLENPNNFYEWRISMKGPDDSPYSGGLFYIKILFPQNYPERQPECFFETPFYHINVNPNKQLKEHLGRIDTTLLNWWRPKNRMRELIYDLFSFFFFANPDSPYGLERANLYRNNRYLFDKRVKYFTKKYANPSLPYKKYESWDFSIPKELEI